MKNSEFSLFVNRDDGTNISAEGDSFTLDFNPPLILGNNVKLWVNSATVWNSSPNITTLNNQMFLIVPDTLNVLTPYVITIPTGLYDLNTFEESLLLQLEIAGAKPSSLSMAGDQATQKVIITLNFAGSQIDFTQPLTPRLILGFNSQVISATINIAPNLAEFNQLSSFLLHSDVIRQGIRINNGYSQVLSQVLVTASPNSLINYQPQNPIILYETGLGIRSQCRFWITNEKNEPIEMPESFSMLLVFETN